MHTYKHTNMHTYKNTSIQTHTQTHVLIHTYNHTSIQTYTCSCIHTTIQAYRHTPAHAYIPPYKHTHRHTPLMQHIHKHTHTNLDAVGKAGSTEHDSIVSSCSKPWQPSTFFVIPRADSSLFRDRTMQCNPGSAQSRLGCGQFSLFDASKLHA